MTTEQKIRRLIVDFKRDFSGTPVEKNEALEKLIADILAVKSEWVSVEGSELPNDEVICINQYNVYIIGYLGVGIYGQFKCENDHEVLENPTHWMPLPYAPKKQ